MTSILKNEKYKKHFKWVLDTLSLGAVLQYCAYRFLQSTMFNFYYSNTYKLLTMGLLIVFGGVRYLYVVISKLKGYEEKKGRIQYLLRCGGAWLLALPFCYVGWLQDYKVLIFIPVCCMCLYDMEAERVCKWFACTIGTLLASTVICCLSGTVRNIEYPQDGNIIGSYGIINTTDAASYITFLLLVVWCGQREHKWQFSVFFSIVTIAISIVINKLTDSKTALYCGVIISFLSLWDSYEENVLRYNNRLSTIGRRINKISVLAFPTIAIAVLVLTSQYGAGRTWAAQLDNSILSNRLSTTWTPYQTYGIHPFGSNIGAMHGSGGTSIRYLIWSSGYGYIDVAYAMLAIRYGWVITAIVACLWVWMTARALQSGKNRIALTMAILAFHAFSEARVWDVNYNVFLVMPFCALKISSKAEMKNGAENYRFYPAITAFVFLLGLYLLLPRALSWLRTYFYLQGWNYGTKAIYSLLVCCGLVIILWWLWKDISLLCQRREKYLVYSVVGAVMILLCSITVLNNKIENGISEQKKRLEEEETIIREVQESATLPVYAAEAEELYHRKIGGFSKHIFSTDELIRDPKGTVFVDSAVELFWVTRTGGSYTQINESTGIYSYDQSVIEALAKRGCVWTTYYSGKRNCDLNDTAFFNEIKSQNGELIIVGPAEIFTKNMETDQFAGSYELNVVFSLYALSKNEQDITLEVYGEAGERLITYETISQIEFADRKRHRITMTYLIQDTPKVYYAIKVPDNEEITIEEISWQKTGL